MRNILLVAGAAGLFTIFSACGGKDHAAAVGDGPQNTGGGTRSTTGGSKSTAGKSGSSTSDGGAGGDASVDALAPIVSITSPVAQPDPNADGVLTGTAVTVDCRVTQADVTGAGKVNSASVKLAILDATGKVIEEKAAAAAKTVDEYTADFSLTAIAAGAVSFRCHAEDADKHLGSAEISTLFDKGPTITFVQPEAKSARALSAPLDIEFTVDAAPLTKGDQNATVDAVTLDIAGKAIALDSAMDKPGHYRLQVNLADPKLFMPAPNGSTPIAITATNKRTPTAVKASAAQDVAIDGAGPVIQITQPLDKNVIGGKVKLTFKATDAVAGVDPKTIVVALNMANKAYDPKSDAWTVNGDTYTFEFDSRQITGSVAQMTLNVSASDKVGNVSGAASELLYLDNYPPSIDLDPFNIRTNAPGPDNKCSASFDPVGDNAKNDLSTAAHSGTFRAIVWDQTNVDPTDKGQILHFANTNPKSVRLYLQAAGPTPLLVDTNNDGVCDDVTKVDSTDSLELTPVPKAGAPLFGLDDAVAPTAAALGCTTQAAMGQLHHLCMNEVSDMWQVVQDEYNGTPVIYAASPTPGLECTGVSWEFGPKLSANGWACFATRAIDNAGNVGVSRPIRICVNDPGRPEPACATSSVAPPSCTDGCTPQLRWGGTEILFK